MPESITQAQPPLKFIPPKFSPLIYQVIRGVLPAWMRWNVQLVDIQVANPERLVDLYQQFQAGKIRFMMAFRHPSINDPYCLFYLLSQSLPKVAKQQGIRLKPPIHAYFMYDRGIPLWAGEWVGWLYSRLGGTPIRRGKADLMGLRSARQLFLDGHFPMAAAPEGATNGHNEIVSPIEPGISQLAFWCAEDLHKANRTEEVLVVPIGIQYRYVSAPWAALAHLLSALEADSGLPAYKGEFGEFSQITDSISEEQQSILYKRMLRLGERILTIMEQFYTRYYHQNLKAPPVQEPPLVDATASHAAEPGSSTAIANQRLSQRLQALLNTALTVAEQYFNIPAKGNLSDRCRRIEQAGWDWIYREDLKQLESLSALERGLIDRIAEEADLRLWHMRLAESFVSVTGHYVIEKMTVDRFAETLLLLWDVIARIKGDGNLLRRPHLGAQRAQMTIGEPISVSQRWSDYKANRRQAVLTLTHDLQTALEEMII